MEEPQSAQRPSVATCSQHYIGMMRADYKWPCPHSTQREGLSPDIDDSNSIESASELRPRTGLDPLSTIADINRALRSSRGSDVFRNNSNPNHLLASGGESH